MTRVMRARSSTALLCCCLWGAAHARWVKGPGGRSFGGAEGRVEGLQDALQDLEKISKRVRTLEDAVEDLVAKNGQKRAAPAPTPLVTMWADLKVPPTPEATLPPTPAGFSAVVDPNADATCKNKVKLGGDQSALKAAPISLLGPEGKPRCTNILDAMRHGEWVYGRKDICESTDPRLPRVLLRRWPNAKHA